MARTRKAGKKRAARSKARRTPKRATKRTTRRATKRTAKRATGRTTKRPAKRAIKRTPKRAVKRTSQPTAAAAAPAALRDLLRRVQGWGDAHASFEQAVSDFPVELRGRVPEGLPYSAWQLLEHLRLAQLDILDFSRNPAYKEMKWPDDYWPRDPAPPSERAWDESVRAFLADRAAFEAIAMDTAVDLYARIPHGSGQTILREILLSADHTAYHVGEIVAVRRLLGAWPPK